MKLAELDEALGYRMDIDGDRIYAYDDSMTSTSAGQDNHFNRHRPTENVIGMMELNTKSYRDVCIVDSVYVHTTYRGKGVALALYQWAFDYAKQKRKKLASYEPMREPSTNKIWSRAEYYTDDRDLDIMTRAPR